jgi:hypothetical protein
MRRVAGAGFQRLGDHLLDLLISHRPRPARAGFVDKAVETVLGKPRAPFGDHRPVHAELLGDLHVLQALSGQ